MVLAGGKPGSGRLPAEKSISRAELIRNGGKYFRPQITSKMRNIEQRTIIVLSILWLFRNS